ncbi:MAG: 50S ribosomal protein L18e [Methanocalculaceae archaeon]|nr:50S ribosomal protein L18e [Methanocalculaceae archaeon]
MNKTNPRLESLIGMLKRASRENEANIWREIAGRLNTSTKNYAEVNIGKISRYAKENEIILVPGKVLAAGVITAPVKIAALNFSDAAREKIMEANGICMTIEELVIANPKGSRVRILR